jgi:hypothetical protein
LDLRVKSGARDSRLRSRDALRPSKELLADQTAVEGLMLAEGGAAIADLSVLGAVAMLGPGH